VRRMFLTALVMVLAGGFLLTGTSRADAMNNESAAMLAGAIVLFGGPIIHAIATDVYRPAPVYVDSYPRAHYTTRTDIIYDRPVYKKSYRNFRRDSRSGWRYERHERRPH
jgi:ribulose kinase